MYNHNLIVHLSSVHPSFDIRIFHRECKTLARAGYEVVLVAQHDRDEEVDGIRIRALAKPKSRFERMTKTLWQVYQTAIKEKAQIYHFHDPELIPVGILLKLKGKRVVYDVHENVPEHTLVKEWIHPWLRTLVAQGAAFAEWLGAKCFDGIPAATPNIAKRFQPSKTIIVQNFPIVDELTQNAFTSYRERPPILIYLGGISELRGAKEMVLATGLLPTHLGAQLYLAGNFSPSELEYKIKEWVGWERVKVLGWQSREEVSTLLGRSRIGLVVLHPTRSYLESYPIKLFEYMSAGIPVIASHFPLWKEIIEEAGCGVLVDPLDPNAIAKAIGWLLEHPEEAEKMGQRGQTAVYERYNWDHEANKLLVFYQKMMK
jgi:glycosyltransferase involved in cell wall biosynthesis